MALDGVGWCSSSEILSLSRDRATSEGRNRRGKKTNPKQARIEKRKRERWGMEKEVGGKSLLPTKKGGEKGGCGKGHGGRVRCI